MQRRAGPESTPVERKKLPYCSAFEIKGDTPKGQLPVMQGWNEMRKRLLELGEMEKN